MGSSSLPARVPAGSLCPCPCTRGKVRKGVHPPSRVQGAAPPPGVQGGASLYPKRWRVGRWDNGARQARPFADRGRRPRQNHPSPLKDMVKDRGYMAGGNADGQAVGWRPTPCVTQGCGRATPTGQLRDGYGTATGRLATWAGWKVDKGVADRAGGVATVTPGCAGLAVPLVPLPHRRSRLYAPAGGLQRRHG